MGLTPRPVAILAFNPSLGVKGVPEIVGYGGVALDARLRPDPRGARDFHILRKGAIPIVGFIVSN